MSSYVSPADQTELSLAQASSVNNLDAATAAAFALLPDETLLDQGRVTHAVDTGAANAYLVALPNTLAAYTDGAHVIMRPLATNTGASTINVDSLGVKSIRTNTGAALSAGDITVGVPASMRYSTATGYFHLDSGSIASATAAAASAAAAALSAAAAATAETNAETAETNAETAETNAEAAQAAAEAVGLGRGHISGLILSNDTDADHDINVTAGKARDSADGTDLTLSSEITKQIDAGFAAGDDAGGMFTGAVANSTWYHIFLIKKDSDGTIDAGFDTSVIAANIPAGYTEYRRIGSVLSDGSANIINFAQIEDMFYWKNPPLDVNAVATGTALQTKTLSVPLGVNVMVHFNMAVSALTSMYVKTPTVVDDEAGSLTAAPLAEYYPGQQSWATRPIMSNASSQLSTRSSVNVNLYISTLGWKDFRGVNG